MKKRMLAVLLAATMLLGLHIQAAADGVPDFADVPADHWAYEPIMDMTRRGVMKGVGGDRFDPSGKLTAEMFIVLLGRVLYPDIVATGDDWSGPYIARFKEKNLLVGTNITDETMKGAITRYDVAEIFTNERLYRDVGEQYSYLKNNIVDDAPRSDYLAKADDERELGDLIFVNEFGYEEDLADWAGVPKDYRYGVRLVYAMGLMRGDQDGNFNGNGTLTRMEAATILQRFFALEEQTLLARRLKMERAERELAALSKIELRKLSQRQLEELLVQMDDTLPHMDVFPMMSQHFEYEERMEVLEKLGLEKGQIFDDAYNAAKRRKNNVDDFQYYLKGATLETLADSLDAWDLRRACSKLTEFEEAEYLTLMRDMGYTLDDVDAAYHAVYEKANQAYEEVEQGGDYFDAEYRYQAAAELGVAAAHMAKAEGQIEDTIMARGDIVCVDVVGDYFTGPSLALYGEDGRLIGKPDLSDMEDHHWEMEVVLNTNFLDEVFTLKMLEDFEPRDYYRMSVEESEPVTGDIRDLMHNFQFSIADGHMEW